MKALDRTFLKFDANMNISGYKRCVREPLSLRAEAVRTAKLIAEGAGSKPIVVMLSGGVDSEVVLRSFLEAGVEVQASTYRFLHNLNIDEASYAESLARSLNVQHSFYDIDIEEFARTEAIDIARAVDVPFLEVIPQLKLFEVLCSRGVFPVSGNAQVSLIRTDRTWFYADSDFVIGAYRHGSELDGVISFFQRTPEIVLSQLQDPRLVLVGTGQDKLANVLLSSTETTVKQRVYKDHWSETELRPKRHGGELIGSISYAFRCAAFGNRYITLSKLKHRVQYNDMITLLKQEDASYNQI